MGKPLHFKGSAFHRVIPQFMCVRAARARAFGLAAPAASPSATSSLSCPDATRAPRPPPDANRCQGGDFTAGNGTGAHPVLVCARRGMRATC